MGNHLDRHRFRIRGNGLSVQLWKSRFRRLKDSDCFSPVRKNWRLKTLSPGKHFSGRKCFCFDIGKDVLVCTPKNLSAKPAADAKTFNPRRESHLALFIFGDDGLVLLPFFSASTNFSFASLAVSPLIESKEFFVLSRSLNTPFLFSHK